MPGRSELKLTKRSVDTMSVETGDAVFWDWDLAGQPVSIRGAPAPQGLGAKVGELRVALVAIRRIGVRVPGLGVPAAHRALALRGRQGSSRAASPRRPRGRPGPGFSGSPGEGAYTPEAHPAPVIARMAVRAATAGAPFYSMMNNGRSTGSATLLCIVASSLLWRDEEVIDFMWNYEFATHRL